MKVIFDFCSECDCGLKKPIVNKKHYLCKDKNYLRLYGKTEQELIKDKSKDWTFNNSKKQSNTTNGRKKGIKKSSLSAISKKEKLNRKNYLETLNRIKEERELKCSGCGQHQFLSPSHLIRRSFRKDLESDERNIKFHCMQRIISDKFGNKGCHERWESEKLSELETMLDFQENLEIVKDLDKDFYNSLILKIYEND